MSVTKSQLDPAAVESLGKSLRGDLIDPHHPDYQGARRVYNAMIDKHPAVIARCLDVADVITCVSFAAAEGIDLAIRGGGHNGGGLGSVDDGLVIDLSRLRGVRVNQDARTATVTGGTTLGELDHATHAFGLAVPGGIISTTGVGGLTLGGGLGYLTRKYGLSIDNLIEADVVLADGSLVRASESENGDLFWAIRGGGGNFGVVTSFTFQARPVSTVIGGPMLWPLEQAPEILDFYTELLASGPDELGGFFALLTVPPGPPFPEDLHLKKVCGVVWCYAGAEEDAKAALAPIRAKYPPALDGVGELPLPALQASFRCHVKVRILDVRKAAVASHYKKTVLCTKMTDCAFIWVLRAVRCLRECTEPGLILRDEFVHLALRTPGCLAVKWIDHARRPSSANTEATYARPRNTVQMSCWPEAMTHSRRYGTTGHAPRPGSCRDRGTKRRCFSALGGKHVKRWRPSFSHLMTARAAVPRGFDFTRMVKTFSPTHGGW